MSTWEPRLETNGATMTPVSTRTRATIRMLGMAASVLGGPLDLVDDDHGRRLLRTPFDGNSTSQVVLAQLNARAARAWSARARCIPSTRRPPAGPTGWRAPRARRAATSATRAIPAGCERHRRQPD